MSYASDALLKETAGKLAALEKLVAELKAKVEALEQRQPQRQRPQPLTV